MRIGVPREIKDNEFRVGLTPADVRSLCSSGHELFIETNAGHVIGFTDTHYREAGAKIITTPQDVYTCELVEIGRASCRERVCT